MPLGTKAYLPLKEATEKMELSQSDIYYLIEHCRLQTDVHLCEERALVGRYEPSDKQQSVGENATGSDVAVLSVKRPAAETWQWGQMPSEVPSPPAIPSSSATPAATEDVLNSRCEVERTGMYFDLAPVDVVSASRVLRQGMAKVTHFGDNKMFVTIPCESENAMIEVEDLLVSRSAFDQLCKEHEAVVEPSPWVAIKPIKAEDYRIKPKINCFSDFVYRGEKIQFGPMQRDVLQFLFDERDNEHDGWVEGSRVLQKVGSNSRQLSQLSVAAV